MTVSTLHKSFPQLELEKGKNIWEALDIFILISVVHNFDRHCVRNSSAAGLLLVFGLGIFGLRVIAKAWPELTTESFGATTGIASTCCRG